MGLIKLCGITLFSAILQGTLIAEPIDIKQLTIESEEQLAEIDELWPCATEAEREHLIVRRSSIDALLHQLKDTESIEKLKEAYEATISDLKAQLNKIKTERTLLYATLGSGAIVGVILIAGLATCGGLLVWSLLSTKKKAVQTEGDFTRLYSETKEYVVSFLNIGEKKT